MADLLNGLSASYLLELAPDFLGDLRQVLAACADALDELRTQARKDISQLYLDRCDPGFLFYHGVLRNLPKVTPETSEAFRSILARCWEIWRASGTDEEMIRQIARLGLLSQIVTYLDLWDAGVPSAFGGIGTGESFWFLVVPWPSVVASSRQARWEDGTEWETSDAVWEGAGLTPTTLREMIALIYKFKPAHTSCRFIVVALDDSFRLGPKFEFLGPHAIYPVNEPWEIRADFTVSPFYNNGFDVP